jgi:hypothetical protein
MAEPSRNDPKNPQLDNQNLADFPCYLRFEPHGNNPDLHLKRVMVVAYSGPNDIQNTHIQVFEPDNRVPIWLGDHVGKFLFLTKKMDEEIPPVKP